LRKNEKLSEEHGKAGFHFAYIMDETDEERMRGVTIEVTTRFFSTKNRDFTILDAPGHRDFIANMIVGAANANAAILVIDGITTAFERGWEGNHGTTKEHALLARSVGVT
jgi:elongation factor 1 alpha-like protein